MTAFSAGLRYVYRCLVTVLSLGIIYSVFEVFRQGEPNPTAQALMISVGALAFAWAAAAWSRHFAATYVQVCIIPILAALYLFELRQRDPLDEMLHIEQQWGLVKTKAASGQPFTIQISPSDYFGRTPNGGLDLPSGERIFPLGQVADLPTIMCREGARPFAEFEADERGFNNPKGIWGKPVDVMFIGDSMTYGACLPNRDHFVAQIRERFPSTLNLGLGGLGPLVELAQMREFVPKTKPKFIFYMYDENNDLYFMSPTGDSDIVRENRNSILRKYLTDDRFSQHVYERQSEINAALKQLADEWIAKGLAERTPLRTVTRFLGLPLTRASLPTLDAITVSGTVLPANGAEGPTPGSSNVERIRQTPQATVPVKDGESDLGIDYFEEFKQIFSKMVQLSNEAGARFVFVNIPAYQTICDGIDHPLKKRVLDFVQQSGVDFIDLELDFRNADKTIGRNELFAVPPCGGHFSERGYKVIGDRLLQYLQIREGLAADTHVPAGIAPGGWRVTRTKVEGDVPATMKKVGWTETQVYQQYVKFGAVLAADSDVATRTEGASIMGLSYRRQTGGNSLQVTVKFSAYSLEDNEVVAALFVGDGSKSVRIASQPVKARSSASVTLTYDVDELSDAPVNIEVRVGSRLPGTLYINGDDTGAATAPYTNTSLTIEELGSEGLGRVRSLIYVGAALSDSELLEARRQLAAQVSKRAPPGVLAQTFEDAKRWIVHKIATTKDSTYEQIYQPHARVDRVIALEAPVDVDGAAIMGYPWTPKSPFDLVRVKVVVPAWTNRPTSIVVALFVNQTVIPSKVASQDLAPGKVGEAVLEFEMAPAGTEPITTSVRVGPGGSGSIYLNGNANGPDPDMPKPTFTIEEYRPFWR
jgi:hypothetical protein